MASNPLLRHQEASSVLRHQAASPAPRHQSFRLMLRHQAASSAHVINPEDLTGWICPSDRSSRLGLSIPSSIIGPFKRLVSLVCPFHLALWKTSHFWCQTELILIQMEWLQMSYMFALHDQRVLSLGMTRGGKPSTLWGIGVICLCSVWLLRTCGECIEHKVFFN